MRPGSTNTCSSGDLAYSSSSGAGKRQLRSPAVLSDQWNEHAGALLTGDHLSPAFLDHRQHLHRGRANRDHQPSAVAELFHQNLRHLWRSSGHHYTLIGRVFREPLGPVAHHHLDILETELRKSLSGGLSQGRYSLHCVYLFRQHPENGGLIPGAGADLEHHLVLLQAEKLGHPSDHIRLGDGLTLTNRERHVI